MILLYADEKVASDGKVRARLFNAISFLLLTYGSDLQGEVVPVAWSALRGFEVAAASFIFAPTSEVLAVEGEGHQVLVGSERGVKWLEQGVAQRCRRRGETTTCTDHVEEKRLLKRRMSMTTSSSTNNVIVEESATVLGSELEHITRPAAKFELVTSLVSVFDLDPFSRDVAQVTSFCMPVFGSKRQIAHLSRPDVAPGELHPFCNQSFSKETVSRGRCEETALEVASRLCEKCVRRAPSRIQQAYRVCSGLQASEAESG